MAEAKDTPGNDASDRDIAADRSWNPPVAEVRRSSGPTGPGLRAVTSWLAPRCTRNGTRSPAYVARTTPLCPGTVGSALLPREGHAAGPGGTAQALAVNCHRPPGLRAGLDAADGRLARHRPGAAEVAPVSTAQAVSAGTYTRLWRPPRGLRGSGTSANRASGPGSSSSAASG